MGIHKSTSHTYLKLTQLCTIVASIHCTGETPQSYTRMGCIYMHPLSQRRYYNVHFTNTHAHYAAIPEQHIGKRKSLAQSD